MVMRENEIEWEQKGTNEKHLSVLDYKKKVREQEVEELTEHKKLLEHNLHDISDVNEIQKEKEQVRKERETVIQKTEVLEKRFLHEIQKLDLLTHMHVSMDIIGRMATGSRNFRVCKILSEEDISFGEKSCEHDTGII